MSMSPSLASILSRLKKVRRNGDGHMTCCPAHDDQNPSLSIREKNSGELLFHCFAGCTAEAVRRALGLEEKQSHDNRTGEMITYDYRDENGNLLYQVVRREPKKFYQRRPDGSGGWINNLNGVRRVLYRLPELLASEKTETVFICEGEKDCDRLFKLGCVTTTNAGGAGKWRDEYCDSLHARNVAIIPDNDETGRKHVEQIALSLTGKAASIKVVSLPNLPPKGDVSDYVVSGGTEEALLSLVEALPEWKPQSIATVREQSDGIETPPTPLFPMLDSKALHGIAGEVVNTILPHSEAHAAALLLQFLVAFGNIIGRKAHFTAEADEHYTNLFTVLVGASSKGRKGTSWGQILRLFRAVEERWSLNNIQGGLSSGEGLIYAVRDPIEKSAPIKEKGRTVGYERVIVDPGVNDKRLLVMESEFALVLRVMVREGNTLSSIIRQAWDKGELRVMTKNSPIRATYSHISIIAHITRDELRRNLDEVDTANGFANRFLWCAVGRSKLLPEGGSLSDGALNSLISYIHKAVSHGRQINKMERDNEARVLWRVAYEELSAGHSGLLGSATSRAEAQTMRLACLYALLDCSTAIRQEHLGAGLALWRYCEDSARFIFGDAIGDKVADTILAALRGAADVGLTKTDISNLFGKNISAGRINHALTTLMGEGRVRSEKEPTGGGRPAERWLALMPNSASNYEKDERNEISLDDKNAGESGADDNSFSSSNSYPDSLTDEEAERASVQQYDGGLSRLESERQAREAFRETFNTPSSPSV